MKAFVYRPAFILVLLALAAWIGACSPGGGGSSNGVTNTPPVVTIGGAFHTKTGTVITLPASATDADEGDTLTYTWSQTGGPEITLLNAGTATPTLTARYAGIYTFSLVVGDGTDETEPVTLTVNVHDFDGGQAHTVALKPDGTLLAWGYNGYGQLGDGTLTERPTPVEVCATFSASCDQVFTGAVAIGTGANHSLALKSDGTVWAWGVNDNGQVGDGTNTARQLPVQVCNVGQTYPCTTHLSGVVDIAAGYLFSVALKADGTVVAWGENQFGQLGNGFSGYENGAPNATVPVKVCDAGQTEGAACGAFLSGVVALAAGGGGHTLALKADGSLLAWGHGKAGQLGDGWGGSGVYAVSIPQAVCAAGETSDFFGEVPCGSFLSGVAAVDAWSGNSMALKTDGSLWNWGNNLYGELGNPVADECANGTCAWAPVPVCLSYDAPCTDPMTGVVGFTAARRFSMALREDGTVWSWGGSNYTGHLGTGTFDGTGAATYPTPAQVCAPGESAGCETFLTATGIAAGNYFAFAIAADGTLWGWGENGDGQLGVATTETCVDGAECSTVPIQVTGY